MDVEGVSGLTESPRAWADDGSLGRGIDAGMRAASYSPLRLTRSLDPAFDDADRGEPSLTDAERLRLLFTAPSPLRDAHREPNSPPRPSLGSSPFKRARLDVAPVKRRCVQLPPVSIDGPVAALDRTITAPSPFLVAGACFSGRQLYEAPLRRRLGVDPRDRGPSAGLPESWAVHMTVTRVELDAGVIEGVLRAIDVPSTSPPRTAPPLPPSDTAPGVNSRRQRQATVLVGPFADQGRTVRSRETTAAEPVPSITTVFRGEIIDGVNHGLHSSRLSTSAAIDLEYWRRLPAFDGVSPSDLRAGLAHDGWILLRLKETDFINVDRHCSQLSIDVRRLAVRRRSRRSQGHYSCALNRATGAITALYHDSPFQRLNLAPTRIVGDTGDEGVSSSAFTLC